MRVKGVRTVSVFAVLVVFVGVVFTACMEERLPVDGNAEAGEAVDEAGDLTEAAGTVAFDEDVPIDYAYLESSHVVLDENICENIQPICYNSWLCRQLEDEIDRMEEMIGGSGGDRSYEMVYFKFDFNADERDEYIVAYQNQGLIMAVPRHTVKIYEETEEGGLREIFQGTVKLLGDDERSYSIDFCPIAVLDEKTGGYYEFVLPWTGKRIWKYDEEKGYYLGGSREGLPVTVPYHEEDIAIINAMIEDNGLSATKDNPESWDFAWWDEGNPRRIMGLSLLSSGLSGTLDVTGLAALKVLDCEYNRLDGLKVSGLQGLEELYCNNNRISRLEASDLPSLRILKCYKNYLEQLDVAGMTALEELVCSGNGLDKLDVSHLDRLQVLYCGRNLITKLEVSNLSGLRKLDCREGGYLTKLELGVLPSLESLNCSQNELGELDVSGLSGLRRLDCSYNQLKELELSGLDSLEDLDCGANQMKELDLAGLPALKLLSCSNNRLKELDVPNPDLSTLVCSGNQLEGLELAGLGSLRFLLCSENRMKELDVSMLAELEELDCSGNQLAELKLTGLSKLRLINCGNNRIKSLDVHALRKLNWLDCSDNHLVELDVSGLGHPKGPSERQYLDESGIAAYSEMDCSGNPVTFLKAKTGELSLHAGEGGEVGLTSYDFFTSEAKAAAIPDGGFLTAGWLGVPDDGTAVIDGDTVTVTLAGSLSIEPLFIAGGVS